MRYVTCALFAAALLLVGCKASALTSTGEATIEDDPYEQAARINTARYEISSIGSSDVMLRGFVPKFSEEDWSKINTAKAAGEDVAILESPLYQIYFSMEDRAWHYWDSARYQIDGTLQNIELKRVASDVNCYSSRYRSNCHHSESVIGDVSREHLEIWSREGATIRVYSGQVAGHYQELQISPDEVQAYLAGVDNLAAKYGFSGYGN